MGFRNFINRGVTQALAARSRSQAQANPMSGNFISNAVRNITMQNNQMQPNAISPTALSNQETINGVFGQQIPGTFNRNVGDNTLQTAQAVDPLATPILPPAGVQQPITPTYDLNAQ